MARDMGLSPTPLGQAPNVKLMRVLFLSAWFPFPQRNGSELRIYNLLRGLGRQHDVTLLSFANDVTATAAAKPL